MHASVPIEKALTRWPLLAVVMALAGILPTRASAAEVTAFNVRGNMQLLVPQASLLTPDEREVDEADIRYARMPTDPPDIFEGGGWKQRTPAVPDIVSGTPNVTCPLVAGESGFDAPYSAYQTDAAEGFRLNTHASLFYDCLTCGTFGDDHYYFDIPRYTGVLSASLPECGESGVPCLQGQDFCECAGILKVTYKFGPGCTESGPIPVNHALYPQNGRVTVHKLDSMGVPMPTSNGDIKATGDIRGGKRTWFLLQDHPSGRYFVEIELVVGSDPFSNEFRYLSSQTVTGFTCASGAEIEVFIPCEAPVDPPEKCCDENPMDACCNGGVGGICCPCCVNHPGDPCCNGGVGGICCDEDDLSGDWQFIGAAPAETDRYEDQVIYSPTEKVPVIRLDRGEFDNQRLGRVRPPAAQPWSCSTNLARFALRGIHASPFRLDDNDPATPDEKGDYRIASFHVMHDNDLDLLDGQPCGPVLGVPCGLVDLIWSASAAGPHDPASAFSTGDMLWENCVTNPGDIYYTPDAQGDWLHLTPSLLPAQIERCFTGSPVAPCVPVGSTCPSDDPRPFVMIPGTVEGRITLKDEDVTGTLFLDLLEHLDLETFALSDDGGGGVISGMRSWIHADGVPDGSPWCNITAAGFGETRDRVHTNVPFWPTRWDGGQVQSNLLSVAPFGQRLNLDYRLTPAQPGNTTGWYRPYIHLRFFDDPPSWLTYLDGGIDLWPRRGGVELKHEVEPATPIIEPHDECFGKIEFIFASTNKDFSVSPSERPNVLGQIVSPLAPDDNDARFLGGNTGFNGDICPTNHRLALVNLAVPAGQYLLHPSAWFEGGTRPSPFGDQLSCLVECGKVCRMCPDDKPTCTGMTITYPAGQPAPLDLRCRARVRADLRVFDCDAPLPPELPESSTASICTDDSALGAGNVARDADCLMKTGTCGFWVRDEIIPMSGSIPCDVPNVSLDLEVQGVGRACPDRTNFCVYITDPDGNESASCGAPVDFRDVTPPVITCPPDATVECPGCTTPACVGVATATDNCTPDAQIVISFADSTSGSCPQTITRTWTARDLCGNTASCPQLIRVTDRTPPVITCPPNVDLPCPACTTVACTGNATAADDCSVPTITSSDVVTPGCPQVITRTFVATDACLNTASCVQIIRVIDQTAPSITCPADVTVECGACTTPACTGTATATDDCSVPVITFSDAVAPGCPQVITRTFVATNACNLTASCVQRITVRDTTPPVIVCPANVVVECGACTTPACTGNASATDTCSAVTITFSDSESGTCPRIITRTFVATDACLNTASCVQTITVRDTTPPMITCPANATVECGACTTPACTGNATATDCSATTITFTDVSTGACPRIITRTFVATDACLNTASCVQTITVRDTTPPGIVCPANVSLECPACTTPTCTGVASASDACSVPTVSFTDISSGSCPRTILRTWRAEDACHNATTCVQTILVDDNVPPVVTIDPLLAGCRVGGGGAECFTLQIRTTDPPECGYVQVIPDVTCQCIGRRSPGPFPCVPNPIPGVTFDPATNRLCVPADKCPNDHGNKQDRRFEIYLRFIDACGNETRVYAGYIWILHDNGRGAPC